MHRDIKIDPIEERKLRYIELENGEAQSAIWEALECLNAVGIDIGQKARLVLEKRQSIKASIPE